MCIRDSFQSPLGTDGEWLAIAMAVLLGLVVAALARTSMLDATRETWNTLGVGVVVALLALSVAPVTSLLDVKDVVALATAAVAYRLIAQKRDQQTSLILAVIVGVIVRWVIIGSIGSGDSAFFLDTQILATIGIGLLIASVIRAGSRWFGADAMVITSACMLMALSLIHISEPTRPY